MYAAVWWCVLGYAVNVACGPASADVTSFLSVYYDPTSGKPFRVTSFENIITNASTKATQAKWPVLRRISFRSNGCTCQGLTCGCCLGINLPMFNREGCMNFTYDPQDFAVSMNMFMNNNNIFSNTFSAKNPPPLCLPVVIPYVPIQIEACARLFNIYTPGQNLHMCFDFETRIERATLFVLHFDCMRMGADGVALVKPGDMGGLPTSTDPQVDSDIYDEVTEIKY